jgi:hypothetical protein
MFTNAWAPGPWESPGNPWEWEIAQKWGKSMWDLGNFWEITFETWEIDGKSMEDSSQL